jgi:hypothetical protein
MPRTMQRRRTALHPIAPTGRPGNGWPRDRRDGPEALAVATRRPGSAIALSPRQAPVDLDAEREAEKGPDQHDQTEHGEVLQRRLDGNGADDVRRDQELEPEQYPAARVARNV